VVATGLEPRAGGLTAREVAARSDAHSQTVAVRLAELDVARAKVEQTTAQLLPRLGVRASYTRLSPVDSQFGNGSFLVGTAPGPVGVGNCGGAACVLDAQGNQVGAGRLSFKSVDDNYALTATLSVPISDYVLRLSSAVASADANERAAALTVRAERLKVRSDAQVLFYAWLRARGRARVAAAGLERVQARLRDAKPSFALGALTRADLMRLEAQVASTEQLALESATYERLAEVQLSVIMGEPQATIHENGEDTALLPAPPTETLEALTAEALQKRLEVQALGEASTSARRGAQAASVAAWPRLDAFADVSYANPNQRYFPPVDEWHATWSVGAAATWNLGDAFSGRATSKELAATARSFEAQRAAVMDGIRQEVAAEYLARQRTFGALESARRGAASAAEANRVAADLFREGRTTTTDVIEGEVELLAALLSELDARINRRIADVRLEHAVGRDVAH
jgi:outer membrane protein TolC